MVEPIKKPLWSYSRITCFCHCKYEFYLNYVISDDILYPSEGNFYADVGSYVHEILAKIFMGELKPEDAFQYYIDNYDNQVFYKTKKSIIDKSFMAVADYFATLDLTWLQDYEILGVELKRHFTIDEYDFIGFIDLLLRDRRDGKIVVMDHKSMEYPFKKNGEVKKRSKESFELYKKQMYLYCCAIYQAFGEYPKEITWNYFKDGGKFATIPFDNGEYEESLKWFINMIRRIKSEEEFEPSKDFFYCFNLCKFRSSCEYNTLYDKNDGNINYGKI